MKKIVCIIGIIAFAFVGIVCKKESLNFTDANYDPRLSGGAATVFLSNSQAFGQAVSGLTGYDAFMHDLGDKLFNQVFVTSPAPIFGGLGPVFNNVSCVSCHHNDGIGIPTMGATNSSLFMRVSIPGTDEHGGPVAAPGYGLQIEDRAISGAQPEAKFSISYENETVTFPDGTTATLRKPTYTLTSSYINWPSNALLSPRLAPPIFGLGLLEKIPESTIQSFADPNDADGDGIKGRTNYVFNPYTQQMELGRFGLKANTPTVQVQVAAAFQGDMGLTSYIFPQEVCFGQAQYSVKIGSDPELADSYVNAMVFYAQTLAVPARRNVEDSVALYGEKVFAKLNCNGCHKETMYTGVDVRIPVLSNQRIHPYTDMLIHDMGAGLSDGRPDYLAGGNDWRTAPLWGVGLFDKVNGVPYYLHDGRARSLTEAILWHGGEAQSQRDAFVALNTYDRTALLKFLQSL